MKDHNIMLLTDSYKVSHYKQYPAKSEFVYSYFESRGGEFKESVFFGLQYFLKEYLEGVVVTKEKVKEAEMLYAKHFGNDMFNEEGWNYILTVHGGKLPLVIKAVPEGTAMGIHNVLVTVENTDPKCFWLTNFVETLLVQVWYPTTIATNSRECKKIIMEYLIKSGTPNSIDFKLHDFGFRGVSSVETAGLGGAAHLVNFMGSDTVAGITTAMDYYNTDVCGYSIPASEHSTMTSWGEIHENEAMKNMLKSYPTGLVACVSDSFDIYKACSEIWGTELKDKILSRDGTLVIRPDSGEPTEVLPKILDILWDKFGGVINTKGYKVLDPHVRVIQGDGINKQMIEKIYKVTTDLGYSADNIGFGSGGGLLQMFNRDTMQFAFKCSNIRIDGKDHEVYKRPITSSAKNSKKGKLKLIKTLAGYMTVNEGDEGEDCLKIVFLNGDLMIDQNFTDIRERAKI